MPKIEVTFTADSLTDLQITLKDFINYQIAKELSFSPPVKRVEDTVPEPEKPKRRTRAKKAEAEPEKKEEEKPKRRRGRPKKDDDGPAPEEAVKAASEAADKFGTDYVAGLLNDEFGVDNVAKLDAAQRKAFIKEINLEIEDALIDAAVFENR